MSAVTRFTCGHVGRTNDSHLSKAQAFIRVAEIRGSQVNIGPGPCPDCKKSE